MFSEELEELIEIAIADGELTDKKRQVLIKRATSEGVDLDELEMIIDSRLNKKKKSQGFNTGTATPPIPPAPEPAQSQAASAPASGKHGVVNKCPVCGAIVESGNPSCPECGYAFRGIAANSSVEKLSELLRQVQIDIRQQDIEIEKINANKKPQNLISGAFSGDLLRQAQGNTNNLQRINDIIINFPVPTTKEDLLEFILFLEPKTKGGLYNNPNYHHKKVYKTKFDECCRKAELLFPNDPQVTRILNSVMPEKSDKKEKKGGFFGKLFGK